MNLKTDQLMGSPNGRFSGITFSPRCRRLAPFLGILATLFALNLTRAAIWSWSGGGGGNAYWNNSANWGFAGIPGNGDTVVFPASQPNALNTNNISGLVLNQIRFAGAGGGYDLRGNAFTLTNGILATNTTGVNIIEPAITLGNATAVIVVSNGASLNLYGSLSGSVGVTKTGLGTLLYQCSSNNTYTGTTLVAAGTLQLNCTGYNAISGPLVIGDGTGANSPTVQYLQNDEMKLLSSVVINYNGALNLNNHNEDYFTTNLTLSAGAISSGSGTATLATNAIINLANGYASSINGQLNTGGGTLTIQGNGYLEVNANVSGAANIVQTNVGTYWFGVNTYAGNYTANGSGFVDLVGSQVLGNPANNLMLNGQTYVLVYGQVNLTNQSVTLNSTNGFYQMYVYGSSTNATWQANFTNNDGFAIDLTTNCALTLAGAISGAGGLTQLDSGTLTLAGTNANTYAGTTTVAGGTLQLDKGGFAVTAVPGPLVVTSNNVVRLLTNFQINNLSGRVTMGDNSLFDLGAYTDAIGPLTMQGAKVNAANGWIYLGGNITVNASMIAESVINGFGSIYGSVITITNNGHFVSPDMLISANLLGGGVTNGIIKTGPGEVVLQGINSFSGTVTVNNGILWAESSTALGNTNEPATVNSGGTLGLAGSGLDFGLKPLVLNGPGYLYGALMCDGSASWEGPVTLGSACTIDSLAGSSLTLAGAINGNGNLTLSGPGTNTLAGSGFDGYFGNTVLTSGLLNLNKSLGAYAIGNGSLTIGLGTGSLASVVVREYGYDQIEDSSVIINSDGLLDLNGNSDFIGPIVTLNGGANIQNTGAGTLTLYNGTTLGVFGGDSIISGNLNVGAANTTCLWTNTGELILGASVVGAATIDKTGSGPVFLVASNSYTGLTVVQQGYLWAQNSWALGSTNNGTVVSNGATLVLAGNIGITNESLALNGLGNIGWMALDCEYAETNAWAGPITLNADSNIGNYNATGLLHLNGPISGPGGLIEGGQFGYTGTLSLEGSTANTYAGLTTVFGGTTLLLDKSIYYATIPGNLDVFGTLRLANYIQTATTSDVTIESGGLFDCGVFYDIIDALWGSGSMTFGANGWIELGYNNSSSTFNGVMSGPGFQLGGYTVAKLGSGTITLNGNNTFANGAYHVFSPGTLLVNGSSPQVPVIVDSGATFGGVGTVGTIAANGNIAPGNALGILNSSNVTFSASGKLTVNLDGPTVGAGYDQLNINGTNILSNATLTVYPEFTSPVAIGQQFDIINNDGTDTNSGTFSGLPEGATLSAAGYSFKISYVGGTGNDVVLTLISLPGAVAGASVTAGDGSHGIDPNGCNNLALAITNTTGAAMTGVGATLSTTTEGVIITQPYASYPNLPANSLGTNVLPFQISTLPSFTCGTPINLQLIVNSSLGAFTMNYVLNTGETAAPTRYDNNTATNVPDVGTIFSTNTVAGWTGGPITKVTVSLWLGAPIDSDLSLWLISPNGTTVTLASGDGGDNPNFGTGIGDASRTTFDDAAATSITNGPAPFVGTFSPQTPLTAFIGTSPNGAWQLKIQDSGFSGYPDTLRAWSLFLDGTACSSGGGACDYCLTSAIGTVTNAGPTQTDRIYRTGTAASCGAPKPWPGVIGDAAARHYAIYAFTNSLASEACVTAVLNSPGDLEEAIYLNAFNPANIATNYLADAGNSTSGSTNNPMSCSASIPPGATFYVTVNEVTPGTGGGYTLQLSGLPCPPPTLAIQPLAPNQARLSWDTSAGGYLLEGDSNLTLSAWATVTNEPIVSGGRYNVTNSIALPGDRFYRLHQP